MIDSILLDTDVFSYAFLKSRERFTVAAKYRDLLDSLDHEFFCLSRQSHAEILFLPLASGWGKLKTKSLQQLLHKFVIIDPNQEIAEQYASLRHQAEKAGRPMGPQDLWTLATAAHSGLPLITNDTDFFWDHGVDIITLNESFSARMP